MSQSGKPQHALCLTAKTVPEVPKCQGPSALETMGQWNSSLDKTRRGLEEGTGNPLQYSCLENPRDRGAWWAAIYGVAQSQTRLK